MRTAFKITNFYLPDFYVLYLVSQHYDSHITFCEENHQANRSNEGKPREVLNNYH